MSSSTYIHNLCKCSLVRSRTKCLHPSYLGAFCMMLMISSKTSQFCLACKLHATYASAIAEDVAPDPSCVSAALCRRCARIKSAWLQHAFMSLISSCARDELLSMPRWMLLLAKSSSITLLLPCMIPNKGPVDQLPGVGPTCSRKEHQ